LSGLSWATATLSGGAAAGNCSGPAVTWSYDTHTGTGGAVTTSPVLSFDGQKVAFVESLSTGSVLHILRPKTSAISGTGADGTVVAPAVPTTVTSTPLTWTDCLATSNSCMFNLIYNSTSGTTKTNTNSSPFYNYLTDEAYVGDDSGKLWKITGLFGQTLQGGSTIVSNGLTPALATGWTSGISTGTAAILTGPVFDFSSKNVFVGDSLGGMTYFRDTGSTAGSCTIPCAVRVTGSFNKITDPPIVDSSTGKVHFFGLLGTTTFTPKVVQTGTILTNVVSLTVGGTGAAQIHNGTFDNTYYNSADGSGNLYVCGHVTGSTANTPQLYSIALNSGTMGGLSAPTTGLALGTGTGECSPLTEIYNTNQATDWMFVGIPSLCGFGGSTTGCVMSFDITSAFPTTAIATGDTPGGTSGMVVDNVSTDGHASSLYYSTLSTATCTTPTGTSSAGGCAVQRTQSGLK
jgi:hypothetical protein